MDWSIFREQVELALSHLRDIVKLQELALAALLVPDAPCGESGRALARLLLRTLRELRPSQVEEEGWPQRRYDLLTLRYVNGLSPTAVASQLSMSRRHFYRQLRTALDEFAQYLWTSLIPRPDDLGSLSSSDLLRRESALLNRDEGHAVIEAVLDDALELLDPLLERYDCDVAYRLPPDLPEAMFKGEVLKQFLLGMLTELVHLGAGYPILVEAHAQKGLLTLSLVIQAKRSELDRPLPETTGAFLQRPSTRLAALEGAVVRWRETPASMGWEVTLPAVRTPTVLVVDDNEDVLTLFQRYLTSGGYEPILARSGAEAFRLLKRRRVDAITLDLMMSGEDGWDVLQRLHNSPETADLPIVVCSVLEHGELALMLGARAFLRKPVMRQALLDALDGLVRGKVSTR